MSLNDQACCKEGQGAKEAGSSNESGSKTENRVPQSASVDNRGQLLNQKENQPIPAQDKGSLGTLPNPFYYHEMTQMLPKIELVTFEGKEPRAWLNKCVKYFEIYHVPVKQRVPLATLFLMEQGVRSILVKNLRGGFAIDLEMRV